MAELSNKTKSRIALTRCTHDICMCGEENLDGLVIGYDLPQDISASKNETVITPRELRIQRLRDRIALGGRSAGLATRQLEELLNEEEEKK